MYRIEMLKFSAEIFMALAMGFFFMAVGIVSTDDLMTAKAILLTVSSGVFSVLTLIVSGVLRIAAVFMAEQIKS